jgi:hypothetical protein
MKALTLILGLGTFGLLWYFSPPVKRRREDKRKLNTPVWFRGENIIDASDLPWFEQPWEPAPFLTAGEESRRLQAIDFSEDFGNDIFISDFLKKKVEPYRGKG